MCECENGKTQRKRAKSLTPFLIQPTEIHLGQQQTSAEVFDVLFCFWVNWPFKSGHSYTEVSSSLYFVYYISNSFDSFIKVAWPHPFTGAASECVFALCIYGH